MVDCCNKNNEDLDEIDLEDNINKVAIEANLLAKQIDSMKAKQEKQQKKGRNASSTTI